MDIALEEEYATVSRRSRIVMAALKVRVVDGPAASARSATRHAPAAPGRARALVASAAAAARAGGRQEADALPAVPGAGGQV